MNFKNLKNYLNKVLVFYFPGKAGYWNSLTPCAISSKPEKVLRYYLNFISKVEFPDSFTKGGIPLYTNNLSSIEHPIVIAQYALGLYELLYQKDFKDEDLTIKFLNMADWFIINKVDFKDGVGWYIHMNNSEYSLDYPWLSCMAQGEAISVLTRAFLLTNKKKYEILAIKALAPFEYDVKDGGVVNNFKSIPVYEEFPSPQKTMVVLNGFIFALFGLYDLYLLNKNQKAFYLFNRGVNSLKIILPYFDLKNWTRYYLFDYPNKYYSSYTYHILVAEQLKALYYITFDSMFKEYSDRWLSYSRSFIKKSIALVNKLSYANKVIP